MSEQFTFDPKLDFAIERFIDAPTRLVWEALTKPEHLKEWYMPKAWGRVTRAEMDVRPGGILSISIATGDGQESPNLGCILEVVPMERLSSRPLRRHSDHGHHDDGDRGDRHSLRLHGAAPGRS
jgi:uncharacterized protein YndB with AHSA1/START domain